MNFIKVPFADSGDKTPVPETDAGGGVNMTQGYTQAYSLDSATDPSAKRIEREKMNALFNVITSAINALQVRGVASYISAEDNDGSPFSYGKGAVVILDGVVYQSLVNTNTDTPPSSKWSVLLNSDSGSSLPVGVPVPWSLSTPPTGWLKCNGATFSASQYPKLALAYPSLKLPDLRGEFLRGWDDGRGVDSGRGLLSSQAHGIPKIYGYFQTYDAGGDEAPTGPFTQIIQSSAQYASGTSAGTDERIFFDSTRIIPDAAEVRPRNIAFNYIVRAA